MKKLALAFIGLIAFGTISCYAEKIKGNGNIITKEIQVADYTGLIVGQGIESNGSFFAGKNKSPQINYSQQTGKAGLKITIDENLLPLIKFNTERNQDQSEQIGHRYSFGRTKETGSFE